MFSFLKVQSSQIIFQRLSFTLVSLFVYLHWGLNNGSPLLPITQYPVPVPFNASSVINLTCHMSLVTVSFHNIFVVTLLFLSDIAITTILLLRSSSSLHYTCPYHFLYLSMIPSTPSVLSSPWWTQSINLLNLDLLITPQILCCILTTHTNSPNMVLHLWLQWELVQCIGTTKLQNRSSRSSVFVYIVLSMSGKKYPLEQCTFQPSGQAVWLRV